MKYVSTLTLLDIMAVLTILACLAGSSFAGDETLTQLKFVFKSCEKVEANKNLSPALYEEAISDAKTEIEFLRRIGGVSQICLLSLERFAMSHGTACLGRSLEEDMLQRSGRAVVSSVKQAYYGISKESRELSEDSQKSAARNLDEAHRNCLPQEYQ